MTLAKPISEGKARVHQHQAHYKAAGHNVRYFTIELQHHPGTAETGEICIAQILFPETILQLILRNPFNSHMHIQKRGVCFVLLLFSL